MSSVYAAITVLSGAAAAALLASQQHPMLGVAAGAAASLLALRLQSRALRRVVSQHTHTAREAAAELSRSGLALARAVGAADERSCAAEAALERVETSAAALSDGLAGVGQATASAAVAARAYRDTAKATEGDIERLREAAEETASAMGEVDAAIDQVRDNAETTARITEAVSGDAERGVEAVRRTLTEIAHIQRTVDETSGVILRLGEHIRAIGSVTRVIDEITERTNLLALNAAILAAQAGDPGSGFAVVADEIKALAERAAAGTREIEALIETIQGDSQRAIRAVERGTVTVERGVEVSREAERALTKILESSQRSTVMVRSIARATEAQGRGARLVTDSVRKVEEGVGALATRERSLGDDASAWAEATTLAQTQSAVLSAKIEGAMRAIEALGVSLALERSGVGAVREAGDALGAASVRAQGAAIEREQWVARAAKGA